jgi:hypothetical protein
LPQETTFPQVLHYYVDIMNDNIPFVCTEGAVRQFRKANASKGCGMSVLTLNDINKNNSHVKENTRETCPTGLR